MSSRGQSIYPFQSSSVVPGMDQFLTGMVSVPSDDGNQSITLAPQNVQFNSPRASLQSLLPPLSSVTPRDLVPSSGQIEPQSVNTENVLPSAVSPPPSGPTSNPLPARTSPGHAAAPSQIKSCNGNCQVAQQRHTVIEDQRVQIDRMHATIQTLQTRNQDLEYQLNRYRQQQMACMQKQGPWR